MKTITIGKEQVGPGQPCFLIAEIGINHNGSVEIAKQLIDLAAKAGFQAVKFQKRTVDVVYTADELKKSRSFDPSFIKNAFARAEKYGYNVLPKEAQERLKANPEATTNGDLKYALEFNGPEYDEIDAYCRGKGIMWSASPWDVESVKFLSSYGVPFYKTASASLTDAELLRAMAGTDMPMIISTGMSTMEQVRAAVNILGSVPLAILHCVSTYPAKDEDLNLRVITTLSEEFPDAVIGYSGHENGSSLALAAVALGASIIERHVTLDRTMPGSDQAASLEPFRLELMATNIRRLGVALGDGVKRVIPAEEPIREKLRRVTDF